MFDRSWYNRAGVERVMGFCTPDGVPGVHAAGTRVRADARRTPGIHLIKFWFSVSQAEQQHPLRHPRRSTRCGSGSSPRWTSQSLDKWDDYTEAKEAMFFYTDTADAPWTVVKCNDKKRARLEAIRHVLEKFDYDGKDPEVVGKPDPKIIGPSALLSEQTSTAVVHRGCDAYARRGSRHPSPRSPPRPSCARRSAATPAGRAVTKDRPSLHPLQVEWLQTAPFCVLATSDADGNCDASPKGDPAGQLIYVLDPQTIVIAERPGNKRADGYLNVLANPHVGLIALIPGRNDTLRVNGRARIVRDAPWFDDLAVRGKRPVLALVIEVEQVFSHCAKAFMRSALWEPDELAVQ